MGRPSRRTRRTRVRPAVKLGLPPGTPVYVGQTRERRVGVCLLDFDRAGIREDHAPTPERIAAARATPAVTWLDIDGVHDPDLVARVGAIFQLHPLWIEDILNPTTRPKVEWLGDRLLVILRVVRLREGELRGEQVALVLGPTWVLSFQEERSGVWDGVRQRIRDGVGRMRERGADFLLHALVDVVVDLYFAVLRTLDEQVDALEDAALAPRRTPDLLERVAVIRDQLALLAGAVWPLREAIATLLRGEGTLIGAEARPFYRDLADHVAQLLDALESTREQLRGAVDLHLAMTNAQLGEVMRVLTLVSTIFIPLSFVAGVYGMNFEHMPELHWSFGYPTVLLLMAGTAAGMLLWFRRKGWIG